MQPFKSLKSAQRFLAAHSAVHNTSVDAPSGARGIFGTAGALVGCSHLFGLGCGRSLAAGPYGSAGGGIQIIQTCLEHAVLSWFSQPGLTTVAPYPSC